MNAQLALDGAATADPPAEGFSYRTLKRAALIDGNFRYYLTRRWGPGLFVTWIMLNPSLADAERDDQTLRKIMGFTRAWGYNALAVVNLYARRSTDPDALLTNPHPVGRHNDDWVEHFARSAALVVAAWGSHAAAPRRAAQVTALVHGVPLHCLGTTKDGAPRHPSRLAYATTLSAWTPPDREETPCAAEG